MLTIKAVINDKEIDSIHLENIGKDGKNENNNVYTCKTKGHLPFLISHNPKLGWKDLAFRSLQELYKREGGFKRK